MGGGEAKLQGIGQTLSCKVSASDLQDSKRSTDAELGSTVGTVPNVRGSVSAYDDHKSHDVIA